MLLFNRTIIIGIITDLFCDTFGEWDVTPQIFHYEEKLSSFRLFGEFHIWGAGEGDLLLSLTSITECLDMCHIFRSPRYLVGWGGETFNFWGQRMA